jgi:hypothetical protein
MDIRLELGFLIISHCVPSIEVTSWFEIDVKFVYVYKISNATFLVIVGEDEQISLQQ